MIRFLLIFMLLAAPCAYAVIPSTDWVNLAYRIYDNFRSMQEYQERLDGVRAQMEQAGVLTEVRVDNWNNASANAALRLNQQRTDAYNLELAQDARPALHACAPVGVSRDLEAVICNVPDRADAGSRAADRASVTASPTLYASLNPTRTATVSPSPDRPRYEELSIDAASALMGLPVSHDGALSQDVAQLLKAIFPARQTDTVQREWTDAQTLIELQAILRANLPRKLGESVAARRAESAGASEASALQAFASDQFSRERIANLTTEGTMTPAALWRERYSSRAFRVWRTLNEYELSLDQELVLAMRLLEAVDGNRR